MLMFENQEPQEEGEVTTTEDLEPVFMSYGEAENYIRDNDLTETHQIWRGGGNNWYVRPKDYRPNPKVAKYEDTNHITELRRRMAAVSAEEAQVICEVMVRQWSGFYMSALSDYISDITSYNDVVRTLVETIEDDDKRTYGEA